jgi:hypothetical protein
MTSKTASDAEGERQVTVTLHDNLGVLPYKLTGDAVASPSPGDLFHERTGQPAILGRLVLNVCVIPERLSTVKRTCELGFCGLQAGYGHE